MIIEKWKTLQVKSNLHSQFPVVIWFSSAKRLKICSNVVCFIAYWRIKNCFLWSSRSEKSLPILTDSEDWRQIYVWKCSMVYIKPVSVLKKLMILYILSWVKTNSRIVVADTLRFASNSYQIKFPEPSLLILLIMGVRPIFSRKADKADLSI